jgi:hypothetical protein
MAMELFDERCREPVKRPGDATPQVSGARKSHLSGLQPKSAALTAEDFIGELQDRP